MTRKQISTKPVFKSMIAKLTAVCSTAFLLALTISAVGCSNGLEQDPYANQPDAVKDSTVPTEKQKRDERGQADKPESLRIDSDDSFSFVEGQENSYKITGRILASVNGHEPVLGQDYELTVENINELSGASFDAASGKLTWTPPVGYVDQAYTQNVNVEVTLTTKFLPIRRTTKSIVAVVTRKSTNPVIESVEDIGTIATAEGSVRNFQIVVYDPHADDKSPNNLPRLVFVSVNNGKASATPYLICLPSCSSPTKIAGRSGYYTFKAALDVSNVEVTNSKVTLSFGVMAVSRFGEASGVTSANASVYTSISKPELSWAETEPISVVAGQENTVNFTVYDPLSNSDLTVTFNTRCDLVLGANSTCACKPMVASVPTGTQLCSIRWGVPKSTLQTEFAVEIATFSRSKYEANQKPFTYSRKLKVVQPAPPFTASNQGAN